MQSSYKKQRSGRNSPEPASYPFKPTLSEISQDLSSRRPRSPGSKHEQLYLDSKQLRPVSPKLSPSPQHKQSAASQHFCATKLLRDFLTVCVELELAPTEPAATVNKDECFEILARLGYF